MAKTVLDLVEGLKYLESNDAPEYRAELKAWLEGGGLEKLETELATDLSEAVVPYKPSGGKEMKVIVEVPDVDTQFELQVPLKPGSISPDLDEVRERISKVSRVPEDELVLSYVEASSMTIVNGQTVEQKQEKKYILDFRPINVEVYYDNKAYPIDVKYSWTVEHVKRHLFKKHLPVPPEQQRLFIGKTELQNNDYFLARWYAAHMPTITIT